MEMNEKIEFTEEGLQKVLDSIDFLPEDQKRAIVIGTIQSVIRA